MIVSGFRSKVSLLLSDRRTTTQPLHTQNYRREEEDDNGLGVEPLGRELEQKLRGKRDLPSHGLYMPLYRLQDLEDSPTILAQFEIQNMPCHQITNLLAKFEHDLLPRQHVSLSHGRFDFNLNSVSLFKPYLVQI